MDQGETPPPAAEPAGSDDSSLIDDLRQLAADGRTLVEAEIAYQKSRAAVAGQAAKAVVGWSALALALLLLVLVALVVGLLLALSPLVGPWWALGLVTGGLLVASGIAAWAASRRWSQASAQLSDTSDQA